jgi:hypothetical protein
MRLSDLTYSDEDLEKDALHFFKTQVYEPEYVHQVKEFIADDLRDFKQNYDNFEYVFLNIFYDEYQNGYVEIDGKKSPNIDKEALQEFLSRRLKRFSIDEEEIERYSAQLITEFEKNALCTHMEPYFVDEDAVIATVMAGYSEEPLYSIYDLAREWCMAMHLKFMYPSQVRKFGSRYQKIMREYKGDERLRRLIDFRDKYHRIFKNIGLLRALHASVFSYAYLYIKGVQSGDVDIAEQFIMDNSTYQLTMLLNGEPIKHFDFPVTKYVLERFHEGKYKELMIDDKINWEALYKFTFDAISEAGYEGVRTLGFDSIEAKTMRSFWNKSANMQSMLKALRLLASENPDPVFRRLIEGCEYHLGRKDKSKKKMERFIEEARKQMRQRSYEMSTRPQTMGQELIARFPSVFLVYFQWHHNFRNIYPKFFPFDMEGTPKDKTQKTLFMQAKTKAFDEQNRYKMELGHKSLNTVLLEQSNSQLSNAVYQKSQNENTMADNERANKLREILMNKEKTMAQMSYEKSLEQQQQQSQQTQQNILQAQVQRENSV